MVNIKIKCNFVKTPHKFIIAELSIRKPGSSSVLIISSAIINLRGVSTKSYFNHQCSSHLIALHAGLTICCFTIYV